MSVKTSADYEQILKEMTETGEISTSGETFTQKTSSITEQEFMIQALNHMESIKSTVRTIAIVISVPIIISIIGFVYFLLNKM